MATLAASAASMLSRSCSFAPPAMPLPTMFSMDSTRVLDVSTMFFLNRSKFSQPAEPVSTAVVTPARKVNPSGGRPRTPLEYASSGPLNRCVCMSIRPGVRYFPLTSIVCLARDGSIFDPTAAILPFFTAMSMALSRLFLGSMT